MRIVPIALAIALAPSLAFAQNWTATTGTTKPTTTAPASNTPGSIQPKSNIPPAAQSRSNTAFARAKARQMRVPSRSNATMTGRKRAAREDRPFHFSRRTVSRSGGCA